VGERDEESNMRRLFRGSAIALLALLSVAAAYGAMQRGEHHRVARRLAPVLAATPAETVPKETRIPARVPHAELQTPSPLMNAHCEPLDCADASLADAAVDCPICVDQNGQTVSPIDQWGNRPFAELGGDLNPASLISFTPSSAAAPTPEVSTAAMLTLGFAGLIRLARRNRRASLRAIPAPRACLLPWWERLARSA
jgi:hypothetical protein